jgi:TRAP transporter T-component
MKIKNLITLLIIVLITGCSYMTKAGVNAMTPTLQKVNDTILRENDYELVGQGLPGQLLLIDGFLSITPDNRDLLVIAASGYCGYSLGYVEDTDPGRASALYRKGRDYGLQALKQDSAFREALEKGKSFEAAAKLIDGDTYVPALYWTAMCWGAWINLNMSDPMGMIEVPKFKALIDQLYRLNDKYTYGGAHLLLATYYAQLPALFGGGLDKSDTEFQKAFEISQGKFLIQYVYYAEFYATLVKNKTLFESELKKVIDAPTDILPDQTFTNLIAKHKAEYLLKNEEKLFSY